MGDSFNSNGTCYASLTENNKIKIWNALTNTLEQEHSPDLSNPFTFTCLTFDTKDVDNLMVGTSEGNVLHYSIKKGRVVSTIQGNKLPIECLYLSDNTIYCGAQEYILIFDVNLKKLTSKWKSGNEKINCVTLIQETKLLTAGNVIKMWNVQTKKLLKTFVGHNSPISYLKVTDMYLISGSGTERVLNVYDLNSEGKHINFIGNVAMQDTLRYLSIYDNKIAATGTGGSVHLYDLNKSFEKPLKSKSTVQIASNDNEQVVPIPIHAADFLDDKLRIAYGNTIALTFEDVVLTDEKIQCLIRKPVKYTDDSKKAKVNGKEVHYVTPIKPTKRKANNTSEVLLETRLENLGLKEPSGSKDNAHLLIQALNSKDKHLLRAALFTNDESVIKNTVNRLTLPLVVRLLQELSTLIQGKTGMTQVGVLWLKHALSRHSVSLTANPDVSSLLLDIRRSVENRVELLTPMSRLKGKIDLLSHQMSETHEVDDEACVVFKDRDPVDFADDSSDEERAMDYSSTDGSEMEFQDDELQLDEDDSDD